MVPRLFLFLFFGMSHTAPQETTERPLPFLDTLLRHYTVVRDVARSPSCSDMYVTIQTIAGDTSMIARIDHPDSPSPTLTLASFSGTYHDLEPFLTKDGLRCYFASARKRSTDTVLDRKDHDIWFVRRAHVDSAWGNAEHMDSNVNSESNEYYPCVTASGSVYFTSDRPGGYGFDDIYVSVKDTLQRAAVLLPAPLNSPLYEFNAYVTDDEQAIFFSIYKHPDGLGSGDLFVSRRTNDSWSTPVNLGSSFNSRAMDYCPYFEAYSGLLYFTSKRSGKSSLYVQRLRMPP